MKNKTNIGLVEHAKRALAEKWFYGWGAHGQIATPALVESLVEQYKSMNTHWRNYMLRAVVAGTRLCDCYGLVKGYLWLQDDGSFKYNGRQDVNTSGAFALAEEKGALSTMPDLPGIILWMQGHVAVYIGGGKFIELRGGGVGAVQGTVKNGRIVEGSKFTHWFKDVNITYLENANIDNIVETVDKIESQVAEKIQTEGKIDKPVSSITNPNKVKIRVDDKIVELSGRLINGFNYISLREIAPILGYSVDYDEESRLAVLRNLNWKK